MKREQVRERHVEGLISATHVIQNPANPGEWIVFFKKSAGRSYFLVDDNDEVESFGRLDDLIETIQGTDPCDPHDYPKEFTTEGYDALPANPALRLKVQELLASRRHGATTSTPVAHEEIATFSMRLTDSLCSDLDFTLHQINTFGQFSVQVVKNGLLGHPRVR
mgnify:CR=1 FL=1